MNRWCMRGAMSYSFSIHMKDEERKKIDQLMEKYPSMSRNAIVRMAILAFDVDPNDEIEGLKAFVNALHKQSNPHWKRKKTLPYPIVHGMDEYKEVANYESS
jgi:hypothetical protein